MDVKNNWDKISKEIASRLPYVAAVVDRNVEVNGNTITMSFNEYEKLFMQIAKRYAVDIENVITDVVDEKYTVKVISE